MFEDDGAGCPACGKAAVTDGQGRRTTPGVSLRPDHRRTDPETSAERNPTWDRRYDGLFKHWLQNTYRLSGCAPSDSSLEMAARELGIDQSRNNLAKLRQSWEEAGLIQRRRHDDGSLLKVTVNSRRIMSFGTTTAGHRMLRS